MKKISKIISTVFLSFSILLLCYVFYRSHFINGGIKFDYYLQYYIIAFLFIILSLISFFIPKKLKINITIVFVSTIIGLYIAEGYLTIQTDLYSKQQNNLITKKKFEIYKNNTGKDYDKRTKFEIYNDLKKKDPNIVIALYPVVFLNDNNLDYYPLSGPSNRKTIDCNENGYYSIFQSDRYGFNNPDEEWDKDKIEYLLIGDSFTQGQCVNEPNTIAGNLRKLNNNKNGVLNLGYGGNSFLLEYATLREYLPEKKVKRVLWLFSGNDMRGIESELKNKILVNYLKDKNFSQNLILRKQEMQKLLLKKLDQKEFKRVSYLRRNLFELEEGNRTVISLRRIPQNKLVKLLKFVRLDLIRGRTFSTFTSVQKTALKNILKLSNEFTKQNNSKLYFVYLPEHFFNLVANKPHTYMNYKAVIQIVESLNIPVIDIQKDLFEKHKDPLSLYPFRILASHFNEKGYQLVTETIFNKINELER